MTGGSKHPRPEEDGFPESSPTALLYKMGLLGSRRNTSWNVLTGGVSSDIWVVKNGSRKLVVKRPRLQLDVENTWIVPVSRGQAEVNWLRLVSGIFPDNVPQVLGFDPETCAIALTYLPANHHVNWKNELMAGRVKQDVSPELGRLLAGIHSATFLDNESANLFDNDDLFYLLRIEPFFERSARAVPEVSEAIERIVNSMHANRNVLIHGDLSPKNVLVNISIQPPRPVILDAECAVWGDPAFDVAFCLAHLALKSIHVSSAATEVIALARGFRKAYLEACPPELASGIDARLTSLIPALLLARIVGGSPAGYLDAQEQRLIRRAATSSLLSGEPCGVLLHEKIGLRDSPW